MRREGGRKGKRVWRDEGVFSHHQRDLLGREGGRPTNLVAVGDLVVPQRLHARPQHHQVGVDVARLPQPVPRALSSGGAL